MLYNLYQLWNVYRIILHLHVAYIAYSFLCWSLSTSYFYLAYMISFIYIVEPIRQLEDKDRNILDKIN